MNLQTAHIGIVDSEGHVAMMINCQQPTKSYARSSVLVVDQLDFELQSHE